MQKLFLVLTATFFSLVLGAVYTPRAAMATGIEVGWNNGCSQTNPASCHGNTAHVSGTIVNNTAVTRTLSIRQETYSCDFSNGVNCGQNAVVTYTNVKLLPGQPTTVNLSRQSPQTNCGSAQVDFYVTDLATGVRIGPYWGYAYTGVNCPTVFPVCPVSTGGLVNGLKPNVFYATGLHWIVGNPVLQSGADAVYFLGGVNPKDKVLQCYYPDTAGKSKIQTDWLAKNNLSLPGWIIVANGADFGLNAVAYFAKNLFF